MVFLAKYTWERESWVLEVSVLNYKFMLTKNEKIKIKIIFLHLRHLLNKAHVLIFKYSMYMNNKKVPFHDCGYAYESTITETFSRNWIASPFEPLVVCYRGSYFFYCVLQRANATLTQCEVEKILEWPHLKSRVRYVSNSLPWILF